MSSSVVSLTCTFCSLVVIANPDERFVRRASGCGNLLNTGNDIKIATAFAVHRSFQSLAMTVNDNTVQECDATMINQRTESRVPETI